MEHRNRKHRKRVIGGAIALWLAAFAATQSAVGCGLDWTLPHVHFESVEEHGYVSYWEKIGEIDLGGAVLPVHIGFDSHREASSSVLGKGWIVALLESHVEPIDENAMRVIMPDGWTFLFLRNGNTETWRGNAGWVGETKDTQFTIAARCGWKIRYDRGKIQEIDGAQAGTLTYSYNGGVPTEIDRDGHALLQVERDPASGSAAALVVDGHRIALSLAQRPRVVSLSGQNLIEGLDPSLASLSWPDGRSESFKFGTDKVLNPTLTVSGSILPARTFVWDAKSRQIKSDGGWTYTLQTMGDHLRLTRVSTQNQKEIFEENDALGTTAEKSADGIELITTRFVSGPFTGKVRKVEGVGDKGGRTLLYSASYFPTGAILREFFHPDQVKIYSEDEELLKQTIGGQVVYEQDEDDQGRVTRIIDTVMDTEVKRTYDAAGSQVAQVFQHGTLLYSEQIDRNNKLVSIDEGGK